MRLVHVGLRRHEVHHLLYPLTVVIETDSSLFFGICGVVDPTANPLKRALATPKETSKEIL
jgi:hypothetical protein